MRKYVIYEKNITLKEKYKKKKKKSIGNEMISYNKNF